MASIVQFQSIMVSPLRTSLLAALALTSTLACQSDSTGTFDDYSRADEAFEDGPLYVTGAFDGSKKFAMWVATMEFARQIERDFGKALHFTYFINSCYYDHSTRGSWIGHSHSAEEDTVRMALTQQAINEGHEIGSHTVLHKDGSEWSEEEWRQEFQDFDDDMSGNLFQPIFDEQGKAVFPNWQETTDEIGETGASCTENAQCDSNECLMVTADEGFCTQRCNGNRACPNDTVCGAPDWQRSTDRCVPMPSFPVEHNGEILFDEEGKPNLEHPDLVPYKMIGFRAPQLGRNPALYTILTEFGFQYDTSDVLSRGIAAPFRAKNSGQEFPEIMQYGLMKNSGSRTIPMDYNYKVNDTSGARMLSDYKQSIVDAYNSHGRVPWNIGHHFALWKGGAYWKAMKDSFVFAAEGCPDSAGNLQCENVEFPSFAEMHAELMSKGSGSEREDGRDLWESDNREDPSETEAAHTEGQNCGCSEEDIEEE